MRTRQQSFPTHKSWMSYSRMQQSEPPHFTNNHVPSLFAKHIWLLYTITLYAFHPRRYGLNIFTPIFHALGNMSVYLCFLNLGKIGKFDFLVNWLMRKPTDLCLFCQMQFSTKRNSHIFPKFLSKKLFGSRKRAFHSNSAANWILCIG